MLAESRSPARRLDLAGLVLATGAVFAFTDGLLRGPVAGWASAQVLVLFAGGPRPQPDHPADQRRVAEDIPT